MENISIFDVILIILTLFLGLKGLMRGVIKELFGLIGIIGGVFFASRLSHDVGYLISDIVPMENESTKSLVGFVLAFIIIWILAYIIGLAVAKIFSLSGLGFFDRLLGFLFGAAKIFLIFAVIIYALSKIETIKTKLDNNLGDTIMYPILQEVGNTIIKLDTGGITKKIEKNIGDNVQNIKENISQEVIKEQIDKMGEK